MKKRCSRCHARLDGNRKTCPYCGTMVRKRRGNVKVSSSVRSGGVGGIFDNISLPALTGKHLLAIAAVVAVVLIVIFALGCGSCGSCGSCSSCAACSSCGESCTACSACASCGESGDIQRLNGANYNCEYYRDGVFYYVDGDRLMALEDGMDAARTLVSGNGIECIYADDDNIYYIISGKVLSAPVGIRSVSDGDVPPGSVLLEPAKLGLEKINGFAPAGEDELCFWGQKPEGEKIIGIIDRSGEGKARTLHTGKYSNVQCDGSAVYFASGEESTAGYVYRIDFNSGDSKVMFGSKADYYTISGGELIVCLLTKNEDGTPTENAELIYISTLTGEQRTGFESFPRIRGLAANDQWVYYVLDDTISGHTLIYRFAENGKTHQLVFRKAGSYRLYGVAGSYFSVYGDDVYYICNYDHAPGSIVLTEHTVLDK